MQEYHNAWFGLQFNHQPCNEQHSRKSKADFGGTKCEFYQGYFWQSAWAKSYGENPDFEL